MYKNSPTLKTKYIVNNAPILSDAGSLLDFLQNRGFRVEDIKTMQKFLKKNYKIVNYLYTAHKKIQKHFGESNFKLGLFSKELYLEVETKLSPIEANKRLSEINKELIPINITLRFA